MVLFREREREAYGKQHEASCDRTRPSASPGPTPTLPPKRASRRRLMRSIAPRTRRPACHRQGPHDRGNARNHGARTRPAQPPSPRPTGPLPREARVKLKLFISCRPWLLSRKYSGYSGT